MAQLVSARNGCAPSVDRCGEEIDHLPSTTGQGIKAAGLKDYRAYQVLVKGELGLQKALLIMRLIFYFNEHLISQFCLHTHSTATEGHSC